VIFNKTKFSFFYFFTFLLRYIIAFQLRVGWRSVPRAHYSRAHPPRPPVNMAGGLSHM